MSTATTLTRVYAGAFDLHETNITSTLSWCLALAVIAILAMRQASTSIFRSIFGDNRRSRVFYSKSEIRIRRNKSVVAFANLGRNTRTIVTSRADRLASANFRVSIPVETHAEIRRRTCAIATFNATNRLTSERNVFPVVINHAITILADAEIGCLANSICSASRVTDRVAHCLRIHRQTIARIAAAYVGLYADTVLATRIANRFAKARTIAFGRLVAGIAGAFVWRNAISIDAISLADRLAFIPRIGTTIARIAHASVRCDTETVDAFLATYRLADVGTYRTLIADVATTRPRSATESIYAFRLADRLANRAAGKM